MLTHIPTIALLSTALITITLWVSKWGAKVIPERPELDPVEFCGWVEFPEDFRPARNISGGGSSGKHGLAVTQTIKGHDLSPRAGAPL